MGTVATAKVINSSWGAVNFRPALESDAVAIREIYAPYVEESAISFEEKVPSVYEMAARIRARQGKFPFIVAERAGTIVGFAYASAFHERSAYRYCAEVTIYLDRNSRRGGIGQALYHRLEQLLQIQGFTNLYACIAYSEALAHKQLDSDPYLTLDSVRFHERMGYVLNGVFHHCGYKFGRWYDMCWMEKILHGQRDEGADLLSCDEAYESLDMVITDRHADECK